MDRKFIIQVAKEQGVVNLTPAQIKKAHQVAKKSSKENYYYTLKEYFQN